MFENVGIAFGLTFIAGMGTGVGALIAFFAKRTNYRFLSIATGFSAGVMLYISFVELFFEGEEMLTEAYGRVMGNWVNVIAFFGGMLVIGLIDTLVPSRDNPHETPTEDETAPLHDPDAPLPVGARKEYLEQVRALREQKLETPEARRKLMRMGVFTALAIAIHNFPEGLVTFLTALEDPSLGVAIAIALALHNIPEGISVSVPIFYATGSRKKAFWYSFLSGLAEPVGALIAYGLLLLFYRETGVPQQVTGIMFTSVAGVMVYISLDELLPTSRAYGKGHDSLIGLISGMAVMALSLLFLL